MSEKKLKEKETIKYLEEILSGVAFIANQTRLDIPKFGRVIATSIVHYHFEDGKTIPYFTFKKNNIESGEFFRKSNRYFVKYEGGRV